MTAGSQRTELNWTDFIAETSHTAKLRQRLWSHGNMALYKFCIVLYCIVLSTLQHLQPWGGELVNKLYNNTMIQTIKND